MHVHQKSAADGGGARPGEGLDAIAQNQRHVGLEVVEGSPDPGDAARQGEGFFFGGVAPALHAYRRVDGPTGPADVVDGPAELGQEVHSRDDEARLDSRLEAHGPQDRLQQAELRPRSGDHRDSALHISTSQERSMSGGRFLRARRPITLSISMGEMPPPGRLLASMIRVIS